MRLILVTVLLGLASCCPMLKFDGSDDELWNIFKAENSKKYSTPTEESKRKLIFLENLQYIRDHNKKYEDGLVSFELAINHLSDLTSQEVYDTRFGYNPKATAGLSTPKDFFSSPPHSDVPDNFDWRNMGAVNPVKDQGACGSCWAFSAVGSLESLHFIKTGQLVSLSEQNLVDCSKEDSGCGGGLPTSAFDYIKRNGGIDTEVSYPYSGESSESCKYNAKNVGATDQGYVEIPAGDEQKLKEAVATIGPISIAIDANHSSFLHYSNGIMMDPACKSDMKSLDHAVVVVGYGTTDEGDDFWLIRNSWGDRWGMGGYAMMARNKGNHCGIATAAVYPLL